MGIGNVARALAGMCLLIAGATSWAETWIDLTHSLSAESVFWPTAAPFELITDAEGMTEAGYYYSAYSFRGAEHGGTHIDAPIHFAASGQTVDEIPLSRLIGHAVVIDVASKALADRNYRVSVRDLLAWEAQHGAIPEHSIVLIHTGYARYWPNPETYLGTDKRGLEGVAKLQFPGLSMQAAIWLARERRMKSVGIDTASIDYGQSKLYKAHVVLMTADIPAFENLSNLDQLPATGAFVVALPTKIEGGSGGPLRAVARIPSEAAQK